MIEYNTSLKHKFARHDQDSGFWFWFRNHMVTIILMGMITVGIALLSYPSFANYWNSFHQSKAVISYAENVANMNNEEYERLLDAAREYNAKLAERGIKWTMTDEERELYINELNVSGNGVMGYITIQKIDITLPIYHGTDESILRTSIGHLEQSSLPVGGESTHCLLSGHRGLPSARLFTDLDKLREGDVFTITVLNETITYEIDCIWIIEPKDFSHLNISQGNDYCTLITCTPYGINTHRLLVRGHRIENASRDVIVVADAIQIRPVYIAPFLAVPIVALLFAFVMISTGMRKNKRMNDMKTRYFDENGLTEAEISIEERDLIIEAVQQFVNSKDK